MPWNLYKYFPRTVFRRTLSSSNKSMSTKSYEDAIEHLNSLQSNAATLEAIRASPSRSTEFVIPEMLEYLERIGYKPQDLDALKVIHITGTKGKGSTSAFTDSILRHTRPDFKIGLYTSPHLIAVRERIRIDGVPISENDFTKYFFEVWDKLVKSQTSAPTTSMPGYFRFLTLMAFHVFLENRVDATVLEVGIGGTYDCTNVVPRPIVTGITALGLDHVSVLGKTIEEIAWQKGGIFKESVSALTVVQPVNAMNVLEARAKELKATDLTVVSENPELTELNLGLAGVHQVQNASLAVELARTFFRAAKTENTERGLPDSFKQGVINTTWPGRCQTVQDPRRPGVVWYLDGAHTVESLKCCINWFVTPGVGLSSKHSLRVLVFNCTNGRSGMTLLQTIRETARLRQVLYGCDRTSEFFDHVIFCTNVTYADGHFKADLTAKGIPDSDLAGLTTQRALASAWTSLIPSFPPSHIHVLLSVEHVLQNLETIHSGSNTPIQILVTGSLHLIGGIIEVAGLAEVAL